MAKTAIIANGQIDSPEVLRPSISNHDRIVAVDGGLLYCQQLGIKPDLLVGDWDSCSPELLNQFAPIEKIDLHSYKDETDLEIAILEEIKRGAQSITLFGALGKRIDHTLTNALLLGRHPELVKIETETETLFAIHKKVELSCSKGQTLSLIPLFGAAKKILSSGLKWELKGRTLDQNFIGISNVCLKEKVTISVGEGLLLCVLIRT